VPAHNKYPSDDFTEHDVISCLEAAGKRFKNGSRYILAQCPKHDDATPSAQIYKDDWFVNCHSVCGRYHITKAYPELRRDNYYPAGRASQGNKLPSHRSRSMAAASVSEDSVSEHTYKTFDLMDDWRDMPLIPRDHNFKNLPLDELDSLGWRWDEAKNSYFIPYFSRSKQSIPFAQWRHLSGERRFTFLKDAKPTCYGTWNLKPGEKLFVVEGASDCAVLEACFVPWIGLPSAASAELMKAMAAFCLANAIELVYAGDNDDAGDKLKVALSEVMPYRVKQPPKKYKDWGEFYVAEGSEAVQAYALSELIPQQAALEEVMPGAVEVPLNDNDVAWAERKERTAKATPLF
jgi:hypothetical protein